MKIIAYLMCMTLVSCQMVNDKLEEKQNLLSKEVKRLDSLVTKEMELIHDLDSLVHKEKAILDSIISH